MKELRDLFADKEALAEKRKKIKEQALAHRDAEEKQKALNEIGVIDEQIREIDNKILEIQNRGDNKMEITFEPEKMERGELLASKEYRSAFFKRLQGKALTSEEQRSITTASGSGGAAVPTTTMNMILGQLTESRTMLSLVTVLNIPNLVELPKENVTNDADWVQEDKDGTVKDDTLDKITLSVYKLMRFIKVTAELSAMSIDAFEAWIVSTMVKKMNKALDKAIFAGTGVNQPSGFDKESWGETNSVTVQETASKKLAYDDFVDLEALLDEDYATTAVYVMNRKTLALVRKLQDTTKKPLFTRMVEDGFQGDISGIPVKLDRNVKDNEIYLGDFKAGYVYNFTKDIELSNSAEAGYMSGSTVYRGMALVDGKPTGVKGAVVKLIRKPTV